MSTESPLSSVQGPTEIVVLLALQQDPFSLLREFFDSPIVDAALLACGAALAALWLSLVARAYVDARERGTTPVFWALVAFIFPFVGYLIYALVRPSEFAADRRERELRIGALRQEVRRREPTCSSCNHTVRDDFLLCPHCGATLKDRCGGCGRAVETSWRVCPQCGEREFVPANRSSSPVEVIRNGHDGPPSPQSTPER